MREIEFIENPERGTAGISSAFQLVESTSFPTLQFGTAPDAAMIFLDEKRQKERARKRDASFKERLVQVVRTHKEALDKLDEL